MKPRTDYHLKVELASSSRAARADNSTHILLVEDNVADQELLRECLSVAAMSADIMCVGSLDEATHAAEAGTFDLVLLDLNLPDSQGNSTVKSAVDAFAALPIIALMGWSDEEAGNDAVRAGAQDYLVKGRFTPDVLRRSIRNAIERHAAHNRTKEAITASEQQYRRLFESAKDGILILDAQTGMVVDVNPFMIEMLGYTREHFFDKTVWELGFLKDVIPNKAHFVELQEKEYIRYEDMPLETADGQRVNVEFVSNVYLVNHHKVIQCNIRDILKAQTRQGLAAEVLGILNRPNDLEHVIGDILRILKNRLSFEAVGIRLRQGNDFPYYFQNGFPDHFVQEENNLCSRNTAGQPILDEAGNPVLECMCGNILMGRTDPNRPFFTEGGSFWTNSTTELLASTTEKDRQARTRNRCNGEGYESVALIPLRSGSEIIGLMQLNDHRRGRFTLDMIHFLEGMGASIGITLSRRRAADELRESEKRFRSLVESAPEAIFVQSHGRVVYVNPAMLSLVGASKPEELLDADFLAHITPEYHQTVRERIHFQRETEKPAPLMEMEYLRLDGSRVSVETMAVAIQYQGNDAHMVFVRDITERKQAEVTLREAQERLALAASATQIGMFDWNLAKGKVLWTKACEAIFGYAPATTTTTTTTTTEHDSSRWTDRVHPDDLARVEGQMRTCANERRPLQEEYRIIWPDKSEHWVETKGVFFHNSDGEAIRIVGVVMDITDRKRSVDRLREKEWLLSESQRLGHIGSFLTDMKGPVSWSDELYRLYGVSPDTFTPTAESLLSLIHPDDRSAMQAWIAACAAGKHPGELEFRICLSNGTTRYLMGRGEAVYV
jgi:PAS domain S-box-containing protein